MSLSVKKCFAYLSQPVVLVSGLFIALAMPILLGAVYQGQFVRYIADDFCTAAVVHSQGWWQAQLYWYHEWSGRFSFTALVSAIELSGLAIVPLLPFVTMLIWATGLCWLLWKLLRLLGYAAALLPALAVTIMALAMYILTNPQPGQAFFWFTGNITYTVPLVLITYISLAAVYIVEAAIQADFSPSFYRRRLVKVLLPVLIGLSFVTAAFNETHGLAQLSLGLLVLGILALVSLSRTKALNLTPIALAFFIASLAGFLIMYQSPGNHARSAHFPVNPTLEETLNYSTQAINKYLIVDWPYAWFIYLAIMTTILVMLLLQTRVKPITISTATVTRAIQQTLMIGFISYTLILLHYAPSYYVQHYPTEARTYAAAAFILALAAISIAFIWGRLLAVYQPTGVLGRRLRLACLVLISLGLSWRLIQTQLQPLWQDNMSRTSAWQSYAQAWDNRHTSLLAQSKATDPVYVQQLGYTMGLEDISAKSDHWINICVADFYQLTRVIGQPSSPLDPHR